MEEVIWRVAELGTIKHAWRKRTEIDFLPLCKGIQRKKGKELRDIPGKVCRRCEEALKNKM